MAKELEASKDDPYLWEIARIKRKAQEDALRDAICRIQHYLTTYVWEGTRRGKHFKNLGLTIKKSEKKLKEMRMLLDKLAKIDPSND